MINDLKNGRNTQLHNQARRAAGRAPQLPSINQHSASLHVD